MTGDRKASILLVDDEPDNLVALAAVLEPLGRRLVKARSGEAALRELLREEFAVILLDVRMPGLDGFETAALIKQRAKTRHVPIIFVTGMSTDTEQVFKGYSEGAVDYLLKPYDPAVLRSKVSVFIELYEQTAALAESEQRFRTAFANAPNGMALVSPEGILLQVNQALAEMVGRSHADLVGARWDILVHPAERDADRRALRELGDGERMLYRVERTCVHADGRELMAELSVSRAGEQGKPATQLIAQLEDVTERREAERERAERVREQAARAEAESMAAMVRNLQSVSDIALTHLTLDELLPELSGRIGEILGADDVSVLLADTDADGLVLRPGRLSGEDEPEPAPGDSFAMRVAEARRPLVVADARSSNGGEPFGVTAAERGVRSLIGVPLLSEGQVGGVIVAGSAAPSRFDDNDAALMSLVADRAAIAVGNARLYEREHKIVETLQRSLLPARLPQFPGISLSARYLPGGADVGGDWYDAIALDGGGIGLAMGDVVGHGIEAAALMGELRNSLRAYALEDLSPGAVVARLDRLVQQLEGDHMATLLYAVIDSDWTGVRFASAGHPPPLAVRPDGAAEFLWEGRSTPLGVGGALERVEGTASLDGGSTLVLYTDGLVEVRGESLDTGLARLEQAVLDGPADPDLLCDHVTSSLLRDRGATDDVALLALRTMRIPAGELRLELPTDSASLRHVRRMLARWLEQAGATQRETREIQLASHEACANAIEHGYGFGDDVVELHARLIGGEVTLTVRDSGGWRENGGSERGQGIRLMNAFMDQVDVQGGPEGTEVELRRRLEAREEPAPTS